MTFQQQYAVHRPECLTTTREIDSFVIVFNRPGVSRGLGDGERTQYRYNETTNGSWLNIQIATGSPITVSANVYATDIQIPLAHQPIRRKYAARTRRPYCSASLSTTVPSSLTSNSVTCRSFSVRAFGMRLISTIANGMPMIVSDSSHARPNNSPVSHHPTKTNQKARTSSGGELRADDDIVYQTIVDVLTLGTRGGVTPI